MKNKNTIYSVLLLLVIVGTTFYLSEQMNQFVQPVIEIPSPKLNLAKVSEIPKFIIGVISKVEGQEVFIKIGTDEKTVIVSENTVIIKQIKEGGIFRNIPAKIDDIKSPLQVVVYYADNSTEILYYADKIQILVF